MHDGGWWSFIRYDDKQDRPEVSWALIRRAAELWPALCGRIAVMLGDHPGHQRAEPDPAAAHPRA